MRRATASRKVSWPCMRIVPSSRGHPDVLGSSPVGAELDRADASLGFGVAVSTTAPAPSANTTAVPKSSGSVMRDIRSAPTTRTVRARPASIWAQPTARAERKPVHAAPMSNAPARSAPRAWATMGAALGITSSAVVVATMTRSRSAARTPARCSARSPARAACELRRSVGMAMRRVWMPVRRSIHPGLRPRRARFAAGHDALGHA